MSKPIHSAIICLHISYIESSRKRAMKITNFQLRNHCSNRLVLKYNLLKCEDMTR